MLFKVVLVEPKLSMMGFEWIEVLAITPWMAKKVTSGWNKGGWEYSNMYLCRTEHGIIQLVDNDLLPEIEDGIYVEEGTPADKIEKTRKLREERNAYLARSQRG